MTDRRDELVVWSRVVIVMPSWVGAAAVAYMTDAAETIAGLKRRLQRHHKFGLPHAVCADLRVLRVGGARSDYLPWMRRLCDADADAQPGSFFPICLIRSVPVTILRKWPSGGGLGGVHNPPPHLRCERLALDSPSLRLRDIADLPALEYVNRGTQVREMLEPVDETVGIGPLALRVRWEDVLPGYRNHADWEGHEDWRGAGAGLVLQDPVEKCWGHCSRHKMVHHIVAQKVLSDSERVAQLLEAGTDASFRAALSIGERAIEEGTLDLRGFGGGMSGQLTPLMYWARGPWERGEDHVPCFAVAPSDALVERLFRILQLGGGLTTLNTPVILEDGRTATPLLVACGWRRRKAVELLTALPELDVNSTIQTRFCTKSNRNGETEYLFMSAPMFCTVCVPARSPPPDGSFSDMTHSFRTLMTRICDMDLTLNGTLLDVLHYWLWMFTSNDKVVQQFTTEIAQLWISAVQRAKKQRADVLVALAKSEELGPVLPELVLVASSFLELPPSSVDWTSERLTLAPVSKLFHI
jgi:hypothetical protein